MEAPKIIPAIMPQTFADIASLTGRVNFAREIQMDVMDGVFVPSVGWPYGDAQWPELEQLAAGPLQLPAGIAYGVHLMVQEPERAALLFAAGGAARVVLQIETISAEAFTTLATLLQGRGVQQIGISINLDTSIEELEPYRAANFVQVMGIRTVGYQGQSFDEETIDRVRAVHRQYPNWPIAVDGGVSNACIGKLYEAGATRFVVGSAILQAENPHKAYEALQTMVLQ